MEIVAYESTFVAIPSDARTIREERHRAEVEFAGGVLWLLPPIPANADAMEWLWAQSGVSRYLDRDDIVPRPDLGLTCVLQVYERDEAGLDGLCARLTAYDAPDVVIPTPKAPKDTAPVTGTLSGRTVTVLAGPGMAQQRQPDDGNLTWGCFSPAASPGSDDFFADRPGCWVSTYVAVWPNGGWPAAPERWLYPEETLVRGAVSETDAWVVSRIVGSDGRLQEIRVRRALRVGTTTWECRAGQRMVPGADEKAASARVEALCAAFKVEEPPR